MKRNDYVNELEVRCSKKADYFHQMKADDGPPIGILGFDDFPSIGCFTYFTHGLHLINKPEWVVGRPEYFIVIDNRDRSFALFFAYLISAFAFEKVMGWNTLIGAGDHDAVDGYPYRRITLGPPHYLEWNDYRLVEKGQLPINLGMGYFISDEDFGKAAKAGFSYLQQKIDEDYDYWKKIKGA